MLSTGRFDWCRAVPLLFAVCTFPSSSGVAAERSEKPASQEAATAKLPAPGAYELDPPHTFAYFSARHKIVGLVRGRFDKVTGKVTVAQDPAASAVDVSIDVASLSTQNSVRDEDLRGPDFFNAKQFPMITYRGRGIRHSAGMTWTMDGELTIRGVTKVVPLKVVFNGTAAPQPGKPARISFHATAGVKRAEFGMTRELLEELGARPSPGPDVEIEIDTEALISEAK